MILINEAYMGFRAVFEPSRLCISRLRAVRTGTGSWRPIATSIGEPKHAFPYSRHLGRSCVQFNAYPLNDGSLGLLSNIAAWIARRYGVCVNPLTDILSLNGTRGFNAAMALCPEAKAGQPPLVCCPIPFIRPIPAPSVAAHPHLVTACCKRFFTRLCWLAHVLNRTAIAYICSPSNPQRWPRLPI